MRLCIKMKYCVSLLVCAILVNCFATISYATPRRFIANDHIIDSNYVDKIYRGGSGYEVNHTTKPAYKDCINLNSESMTFSGSANNQFLYTNNNFTGKSSVTITVTNKRNGKLYCWVYLNRKILPDSVKESMVIEANETGVFTVSDLNAGSEYYIKFQAPSDFSGSVE